MTQPAVYASRRINRIISTCAGSNNQTARDISSPTMTQLTNYDMRDVDAILHPTTNLATHRQTGPLVLDRAQGVHIWDSSGKRYIEGLAGLWCTGLGYGN